MTTDVGSFKSYQLSEGRTTSVSARVSPTDRIRGEIDALFGGSRELSEIIEDVARLGVRLIIQTAVEAEVDVFLGRARYQRAAAVPDARPGSRNGYCDLTIKTTAGPVTVARPKLRGTTEAFASQLFGKSVTKSNALEALVIAGFVRGLSVRDVENTLADALGAEAALSKSTVSRVCQAIAGEFGAWSQRRLDELELDYLFLDASMFKMHPGARAEPVLAAWDITTEGAPVFVALAAGGSESTDAWGDFLDELIGRGLRPPLLVISDGAAGLINACESSLPRSLRQRCLIHRCRNYLAKVPAEAQDELRDAYWAIFDTDDLLAAGMQPGPELVAAVQRRIDASAEQHGRAFPSAVKCLLTDRAQLTSYLRFPVEHHRRIRHSNFIERTFGETRRRVKVIGRLPGEASCLNLVWAVLDRASRGWRGMTMTPAGTRLLADLRHQLLDPPTQIRQPKINTEDASPESVGAVA
ncbi:MAG: IS256 family transposase [Streptosporangiales bacterium]|nr:IS256 family transposase [Streptosporangiales bacterium]